MLSDSTRGSDSGGSSSRARYPLQQSDEIDHPGFSEADERERYEGPEEEEEE